MHALRILPVSLQVRICWKIKQVWANCNVHAKIMKATKHEKRQWTQRDMLNSHYRSSCFEITEVCDCVKEAHVSMWLISTCNRAILVGVKVFMLCVLWFLISCKCWDYRLAPNEISKSLSKSCSSLLQWLFWQRFAWSACSCRCMHERQRQKLRLYNHNNWKIH